MSSTTLQVSHSRTMGMYEPSQQFGMWKDIPQAMPIPSSIVKDDVDLHQKGEFSSEQPNGQSDNDQESSRLDQKGSVKQKPKKHTSPNSFKIKRRLAQNREAARKSRMRKKAYVQQLESSRLKLAQLEQELEQAKLQNLCVGGSSHAYLRHDINAVTSTFEMEYSNWLGEQHKRTCQLRNALKADVSEAELRILVEDNLNQYHSLFRMKAEVAKVDVFYLMSGAWRTSVERFFLWIGGFRPSELLKVVMPSLEPLLEQQQVNIKKLSHSSQQAEDALSQGLERLQQSLGQIMLADGRYDPLMISAREKLADIYGFVNQADHLREQTLQLMSKNLTTHQAARGLIALGDYFHRLSTISALWASRPREFS